MLALVALAATVLSVAAGTGGAGDDATRVAASAWRGLVGSPRQQVAVGQRVIVVLRTPSLADEVARAGGRATEQQQRQWNTAALAASHQLIARLAQQGVLVRPEFFYSRVLAGFAAAIDPQVLGLLERAPEVAGVYPVRVTYPASLSSRMIEDGRFARTTSDRLSPGLSGYDGNGVTIAVLDTGIEPTHPYYVGQMLEGRDILDGDADTAPEANPVEPSRLERHGTQLTGILAGSDGPGGLAGIAPAASILPIRVAGWQQNAHGSWGVYGRTDQLVAGLERAVDPDGDGATLDAARIALVGVAEPFASFVDSPAARAAAGALRLDTLVVAPGGNDGPAGPGYGSIASPGGSTGTLTVGALDLRRRTQSVRVVVRSGLHILFDRRVPLAGPVAPRRGLSAPVALARSGASGLDSYFDEAGASLVAGRAALVAAAAILSGPMLPAGGLGIDEAVDIPVVSIPLEVADRALDARRARRRVTVAIGAPRTAANPGYARVAAFSSRGLAFDGRVKPDLVAPGVSLLTSDAGRSEDASDRYASVTGSSAAAATVAGAAALLVQARRELDASALKGLLVGTARPITHESVSSQGAGEVDLGAALTAEVAVLPSTLSFDRAATESWQATRKLIVRNLSSRPVRVQIAADQQQGAAARGLVFAAAPTRLRIAPGRWESVYVTGRIAYEGVPRTPIEGMLEVRTERSAPLRVPWLVSFRPRLRTLIGDVQLSVKKFKASDTAPAVLSFRAGGLARTSRGVQIVPVGRLDLTLVGPRGERLGVLARLRDLLPGVQSFGLTGRDGEGKRLKPGRYRLKLTAWPTGDGVPSRASVAFTVK
ncbi:MAG TPA: S8 family serine peptidase [Gaiellaceae bacterium]|nr:S8 family serine peptidase [Gaiellaceae bacterium]